MNTHQATSASEIITLERALEADYDQAIRWYADAISPADAKDARLFGDTGAFIDAHGAVLTDDRGDEYLDCIAGFGAVNVGHNHPDVLAALAMVERLPGFMQVWPSPVTPALAMTLLRIAPGNLGRVFLCNSGTEAVEAAIKLVRAGTRRPELLATVGAFHGKTLGALSVSGRTVYREPFEPLIPGCEHVPFGDIDALAAALRTRRFGAFVVEPIQGEAGIVVPPDGYLAAAQQVCRETGTLLVVDEVQTGLGRTGTMFACEREGVEPDILCLAKGLGGGLLPIGACLSTVEVWERAYGGKGGSTLHTSTFGGGTRACAVALKTIEVLVRDRLPERAEGLGIRLRARLEDIARRSPLIDEVRGRGLLLGIRFATPRLGAGFARENAGPVAAALLWREHRIVTINTLNNPTVVRIEPPLMLTDDQADRVGDAIEDIAHRHGSVLGAAARLGMQSLRGRSARAGG